MRTSYVPVRHCEKVDVTTMLFRQRAVIEFLVKEENSARVICERLRGVYGDVCISASSVRRWVKHFKDGNTDIADQPRCGRPRTAATERNK
jgi:transposase